MKLIYKPFALIAGLIAARIGKSVFRAIWSTIDDAEPPSPSAPSASFPKVIGAAALEAVTMASIAAAADRASARTFYHLTGAWPGEDPDVK
jgi:hypothetical protein